MVGSKKVIRPNKLTGFPQRSGWMREHNPEQALSLLLPFSLSLHWSSSALSRVENRDVFSGAPLGYGCYNRISQSSPGSPQLRSISSMGCLWGGLASTTKGRNSCMRAAIELSWLGRVYVRVLCIERIGGSGDSHGSNNTHVTTHDDFWSQAT